MLEIRVLARVFIRILRIRAFLLLRIGSGEISEEEVKMEGRERPAKDEMR